MEVFLVLLGCACAVMGAPSGAADTEKVDLLMPSVKPQTPDTYLCHPMKIGKDPKYIVKFEPHANMAIAHHILLYGCEVPGSNSVWNCGEMHASGSGYKTGPVCAQGARILYAWAMDAPALSLPEDVGFKVGGKTGINYLVVQIHYKNVTTFLPPANGHDNSGLTLTMTNTPQRRRAGVYLLGTSGSIPPNSVTYMETECSFNENFEVHPFAFRTHAHGLGQVTSGYRIRDGQWTEIGRQTPQKPQMFYNSTTPGLVVKKGDILAARCTMKNDKNTVMNIGSTQNDEMCNFYMMYYVDGDKTMSGTYCFTEGPPRYYWANDERMRNAIKNIPKDASLVPGEKTPLQQTAQPGLYSPSEYDVIYDVEGADMNRNFDKFSPDELRELMMYLKQRGPRAYDDDEYF
ncbi:peptidylglycine alpha-hydroxylating monooxygenase-like isoform X2 [Mya arenaria]|nr:peptidylglycine alpha-hydroxylating monooxygenase-like isoform X2 [Mya arenaria]